MTLNLIIGGAGFIGSNLARVLLACGSACASLITSLSDTAKIWRVFKRRRSLRETSLISNPAPALARKSTSSSIRPLSPPPFRALSRIPLPRTTPALADITAAQRDLGYEPLVDIETGLRKTIDWYPGKSTLTKAVSGTRND